MRRRVWKSSGRRLRGRRLLLERLEGRCLLVIGPLSGASASIYGVSFADNNRNGQWDPDEQALSGVEMRLYDAQGQLSGSFTSGQDGTTGRFCFLDLPAGRYTLTVAPGTALSTTPLPMVLELSAGELAVSPHAEITGPAESRTELAALDVGFGGSSFTIERDRYTLSSARLVLDDGTVRETVTLIGPGEIDAYFEGSQEGDAYDDSGNGLDEVALQLAEWHLTGGSSRGAVNVVLDSRQPASGSIEERADSQTGRLDLRPFAAEGTADVTLTVGATVQIGTQVYYLATPLHLAAAVTQKPAGSGESYVATAAVPLLDAEGQATNLTITALTWTPSPSRPWQNPRSPFDVDNDGEVKASDVLTIINFINTHGVQALSAPPQSPLVPPPFVDIDGNGQVDAHDVLLLINQLNSTGPYAVPFESIPVPLAAPQPSAAAAPAAEGEAAPTPRVALSSAVTVGLSASVRAEESNARVAQRRALPRWSRAIPRSAREATVFTNDDFGSALESTLDEISAAVFLADGRRA